MPISVPGHADHALRDDGDHDSGVKPITRSGNAFNWSKLTPGEWLLG
jgi:hypothetical protein